jgi:solute carrier family 4 anion exchanger 2
LILNYDHLNNTVEDPWHPVVIHNHLYDNSTGNTTTTVNILDRAYPNTALLSMCLMFGCFFIAFFLRQFKNGTFLPGKVMILMKTFLLDNLMYI